MQMSDKSEAADVAMLRFAYDERLSSQVFQRFGKPATGVLPGHNALLNMRRKHLLGDAIRITPELLPDVWRAFAQCLRSLGLSAQSGGLYVQQCSEYNANVMSDGENFDIVVNSGLLNDFSLAEFRFVVGHELGHVLYDHHEISLQGLFQQHSMMDERDALLLFGWSRAAEISADRVGLLCAGSVEDAVSAIFKLSSGLNGIDKSLIRASMQQQFEDLKNHIHQWQKNPESRDDRHDIRTHPMGPIRFRALEVASAHIASIFNSPMSNKPAPLIALDQRIAALLDAIDEGVAEHRGFETAAGKDMLTKIVLYVALAGGYLSQDMLAMVRQVCASLPGEYSPESVIVEANNKALDRHFREGIVAELKACFENEILTTDEAARGLSLASMLCGGEAIYLIAVHEIARALEIDTDRFTLSQTARRLSRAEIVRVLGISS